MTYLAAFALGALLFMLFGAVRPRVECNGDKCGACGGACRRRDETGGIVHD